LLFVRRFTEFSLGHEFRDAAPIMACFLIGAVFRGHASAAVGIIIGQGCSTSYLVLKTVVMVLAVTGTVFLNKPWGAFAVAFMYMSTSLLLMAGIGWTVARQAYRPPSVITEQPDEPLSSAA